MASRRQKEKALRRGLEELSVLGKGLTQSEKRPH